MQCGAGLVGGRGQSGGRLAAGNVSVAPGRLGSSVADERPRHIGERHGVERVLGLDDGEGGDIAVHDALDACR